MFHRVSRLCWRQCLDSLHASQYTQFQLQYLVPPRFKFFVVRILPSIGTFRASVVIMHPQCIPLFPVSVLQINSHSNHQFIPCMSPHQEPLMYTKFVYVLFIPPYGTYHSCILRHLHEHGDSHLVVHLILYVPQPLLRSCTFSYNPCNSRVKRVPSSDITLVLCYPSTHCRSTITIL